VGVKRYANEDCDLCGSMPLKKVANRAHTKNFLEIVGSTPMTYATLVQAHFHRPLSLKPLGASDLLFISTE